MKLIARTEGGFLATITETELNVLMQGKRYTADRVAPKIGEEYDLNKAYDYHAQTMDAVSAMKGAWEKFSRASEAIGAFVELCNKERAESCSTESRP